MNIELSFKGNEEVKKYTFDNIQSASYFMGLLQQGIKFKGEMYVMLDHYLDVDLDSVFVSCITVKEATEKVTNSIDNLSPDFLSKLKPAFRTDGGDEGGGMLN